MDPVQKAPWYVESHSRESISLEDIADACKVSPFHLTRAFAATMGLSLMRYVRARRLSEAARQLASGATTSSVSPWIRDTHRTKRLLVLFETTLA